MASQSWETSSYKISTGGNWCLLDGIGLDPQRCDNHKFNKSVEDSSRGERKMDFFFLDQMEEDCQTTNMGGMGAKIP